VQPLATRHLSLQMSELADVTDLLVNFEVHNSIRLKMDVEVERGGKVPTLVITAKAIGLTAENGVLPLLASVSVKCSDMNLRHWNAALTHCLYALDFKLALDEWDKAEQKGE